MGNKACALLLAAEATAAAAAHQLQQAADSGSHAALQSALADASRYSHLAGMVAEATAAFEQRQVAVREALAAAVRATPMAGIVTIMEQAVVLGLPPSELSAAKDTAKARDASASQALAAAGAADNFDAAVFEAAAAGCEGLGLRADVAAARASLERRRKQLVTELQQAVARGGSGRSEAEHLAAAAKKLGLAAEAAAAAEQLAGKRRAAEAQLQEAAAHGGHAAYLELLQAAVQMGASEAVMAAARHAFGCRQCAASEELAATAAAGSLEAVAAALQRAKHLGCSDWEAAEAQLTCRRQAAAKQLLAGVDLCLAALETATPEAAQCLLDAVMALKNSLSTVMPELGASARSVDMSRASVQSLLPLQIRQQVSELQRCVEMCMDLGLDDNAHSALAGLLAQCQGHISAGGCMLSIACIL